MTNNTKNAFFFRSTQLADALHDAGLRSFSFKKNANDETLQAPHFPSLVREAKAEGILRARSDKNNSMPSIKVTPLAFAV